MVVRFGYSGSEWIVLGVAVQLEVAAAAAVVLAEAEAGAGAGVEVEVLAQTAESIVAAAAEIAKSGDVVVADG